MAKNKNIAGHFNRSSTSKTKKASSQSACTENPTPLNVPADSDFPAALPELQTTERVQLGFPDKVYLLASVIFQNNHLEKPAAQRLVSYGKERGIPIPKVKDEKMQHTAYELAFNALKYQELLEDIVVDSSFYLTQPMPEDQMGLVAVMLYDFQDRKFLPWEHQENEEIIQEVRDVESHLLKFKTKLAASLARCRIKHDLLSIQCILPESVKMKQERSSNLPLYAWVNTLKSSCDEVQRILKSAGFSKVKSIGELEGQTFCQDSHCWDLLVFPALLKAQLYSTRLLSDYKLIIQDKPCSLGPYAVCSVLPEEGDVLMVGCFSGLSVAHTASLIAEKHKSNSTNNRSTIYVCVGDRTDAQREELQQAISTMGYKNVKLVTEVFQSLSGGDKRLQKVRVILLTPKCSLSAVSNPVEFILQESADPDLLQDLSQGYVAQRKLEALVAQQTKDIDHALKFSKVLALVYSTCSAYLEENEGVVSRALEQAKPRTEQEGEPKQAQFRPSSNLFNSPSHAEDPKETDPYFILEPSENSNGCFLAVLTREPELVVKEAPQEVLARANAKGILDKIGCNQPIRKGHQRHTIRMTKTKHAHSSQPHLAVSVEPKNQEIKSSSSPTLFGHQESTNSRQATQGKPKALRLQGLKNTVPSSFFSRQGNTSSFSFKPENSTPIETLTPIYNTTNVTTTTLHPPSLAPPSATPVVRPRKAHQEELKPVVLVLPPLHFPNFFTSRRTGFSPSFSYRRWRTPAQTVPRSSSGLFEDITVKSRPLF